MSASAAIRDPGRLVSVSIDGAEGALFEVLARHPGATFLVEDGEPRPMNELAARALVAARRVTVDWIARAVRRGDTSVLDVIAIRSADRATRFVLVERSHRMRSPGERIRVAADRWQLTERQREVLVSLAAGLSNKEIAAALDCAEVTVERHLGAIFRSAGVTGRTRLLALLATL